MDEKYFLIKRTSDLYYQATVYGFNRDIHRQVNRRMVSEYLKRILRKTRRIKTSRAKAVYLLLCASMCPLRPIHIQEILNMSKATVHRALKELSSHKPKLVERDLERKYYDGCPRWKVV